MLQSVDGDGNGVALSKRKRDRDEEDENGGETGRSRGYRGSLGCKAEKRETVNEEISKKGWLGGTCTAC